ncbi:PAS domain-containing protein [Kiloniella sp. EL199]|uniref:PAS domain-containing protein n=1 Tax=Kiloniella sp. EL199 TaxID=2107581 RepID=UPI000EA3F95E|nr:PAS domain-containing protein [Kiloniella sp. EL199]
MINIIRGKELPKEVAVEESFCRLYDYWRSVTPSNRTLPGRQHINPAEITDLLSRIALVDVHYTGTEKQFQYRLWGSVMTEVVGKDCTGKFAHDLFTGQQLQIVQQPFNAVVETRNPHFSEITWDIENREHQSYKRLLLPLAADGQNVNMILGTIVEADQGKT